MVLNIYLSWLGLFPCKPHPFGNEYHSVCCGLLGVMTRIELIEEKIDPKRFEPPSTRTLTARLLACCYVFSRTSLDWHVMLCWTQGFVCSRQSLS